MLHNTTGIPGPAVWGCEGTEQEKIAPGKEGGPCLQRSSCAEREDIAHGRGAESLEKSKERFLSRNRAVCHVQDSLRVNHSLRQVETTINRISSRRTQLENKVNGQKKRIEELSKAGEKSLEGEAAALYADFIQNSLQGVKTCISRETSTALLVQQNVQQQRVLHLLYDTGE